jgi:hypothetical protein
MAFLMEEELCQALHAAYRCARLHVVHHLNRASADARQLAHAFRVIAAARVTDDETQKCGEQIERYVQVAPCHFHWPP